MKKRFDWRNVKTETFSIESAKEGGLGLFAIRILAEQSIPAKRGETILSGSRRNHSPKAIRTSSRTADSLGGKQ